MTEALAQPSRAQRALVNQRLVACYFVASLIYFTIALTAGLLMALQLVDWNPLRGIELFSPGRWRMVHTNAIAYGFISSAFLGVLHWAVPRLTMRPVFSDALSWVIFVAWHSVVLSTAAGLLLGEAQGVEWAETPIWVDPFAQLGLLLVFINFGTPILQTKGPMYVTLWYFLAAFVWTFMTYAMGNFIPEYFVSGTGAGALTGLFIHDLVGLWVTPIGWGMMYYFVPILLRKPMWSHGLSLAGFWGLAFFYPLTGIHHFLYTPIPMFLQYGAVISTIAVEFVVTTVIINFFGTLWGSSSALRTNVPIRWFYTGMVFYFTTCLQCAFQVTLTFQKLIHFTDWVVGHAHLVMFGVFGFWIMGTMTYLFPRLLKRPWWSPKLVEWHYWLSATGMLLMFLSLTFGGVFVGFSWGLLEPWFESISIAMPYWIFRFFTGIAIYLGNLCFLFNLVMTFLKRHENVATA
jgi:cytochrome c oxidase cbb3-type subunit 1